MFKINDFFLWFSNSSWHIFISALEDKNYMNSSFHRANIVELTFNMP